MNSMMASVMRICLKCDRSLPLSEFHSKGRGKLARDCRGCISIRMKAWRLANIDRLREREKLQRMRPERKAYQRQYKRVAFRRKREETAGRPRPTHCEICGEAGGEGWRGIHWDHDHKTGKFRGWICVRCNQTIGLCRDMPDLLRKLADYLEIPR
jgi:Recombination endonuclease VII